MRSNTVPSSISRPFRDAITPMILIVVGLALAWAITYLTGGTHRAFPHTFYVPVIFAAYRFGASGGLLTGGLAMIACGPLMPLDADTGQAQSVQNWVSRGAFFVTIGLISGGGATILHDRLRRSERLHEDAVLAFVKTIDAKSPYTARHSERVSELATAIAREMNLDQGYCERIRWAALLHDVGKLWIPDNVLNKQGPLSMDEWELIRQHPIRSEEFVKSIEDFREYQQDVRGHHERYDGTGYPDGLSGSAIPCGARILAVADAFEAMTSARPYRPGLSYRDALAELEANRGTQFDPQLVRACIRVIQTHPQHLYYWHDRYSISPESRVD